MSIIVRIFLVTVPFIYAVFSCYLALRKDWTGVILFGLGGVVTSAFASWVLFITIPQVHKRIEIWIVSFIDAVLIGLIAWTIVGST